MESNPTTRLFSLTSPHERFAGAGLFPAWAEVADGEVAGVAGVVVVPLLLPEEEAVGVGVLTLV
ncbi:MAG: hypothetical protein WCW56_02320 [Candidatus Paceibacterota bacterium]